MPFYSKELKKKNYGGRKETFTNLLYGARLVSKNRIQNNLSLFFLD